VDVKSVPALILNGQVFHINFSAPIDDIKNNECGKKAV
jgi:hypothetical protein